MVILNILGYFGHFRDFRVFAVISKVFGYFGQSRGFVGIFYHFEVSRIFCSFLEYMGIMVIFKILGGIWDILEVSSYSKEFEGTLTRFFWLILLVSRGILVVLEVSRLLWSFKRFRGIFCRFEVLGIFWPF